jgi:uncharacterized membrane protein YvlD (DUF360 family)
VIRFLISAALFLGAAAIGLLIAQATVPGMTIDWGSFVLVVVIFAVLQAVLAPFIAKSAMRNAPALLGGAGLLTTFVALLVTSLVSDGLTIDGVDSWLLATLVVWLATMLAAFLLPVVLVKAGVQAVRENRS